MEWHQCFDLGAFPYEDRYCHAQGYRQTRLLQNFLTQHNFQLHIMTLPRGECVIQAPTLDLYNITALNGQLLAGALRPSEVMGKLESMVAQERNRQHLTGEREVAPSCRYEARRVRFSNL